MMKNWTKMLMALVLVLSMMLAMQPAAYAAGTGANWTPDNAPTVSGNWNDVADTSWYNDDTKDETFYYIDTPQKLAGISALAAGGESFALKTFFITADIDLSGKSWTPIQNFSGSIRGWDKETPDGSTQRTIKGLYGACFIDKISDVGTTTGNASTHVQAHVEYLTFKDAYVTDAVIVRELGDHAYVKFCETYGQVYSKTAAYVGGIVAQVNTKQEGTIDYCVNNATVVAGNINASVGGIAGYIRSASSGSTSHVINSCKNTGMVMKKADGFPKSTTKLTPQQGVGGIAGYVIRADVQNSTNEGAVYAQYQVAVAGGIVGAAAENVKITNCTNSGSVNAPLTMFYQNQGANYMNLPNDGGIGGILGVTADPLTQDKKTYKIQITGCTNNGAVTTISTVNNQIIGGRAGGIVGVSGSANANVIIQTTITGCTNTGAITNLATVRTTNSITFSGTGGIAGQVYSAKGTTNTTVEKCYNTGKITARECVGGLFGIVLCKPMAGGTMLTTTNC